MRSAITGPIQMELQDFISKASFFGEFYLINVFGRLLISTSQTLWFMFNYTEYSKSAVHLIVTDPSVSDGHTSCLSLILVFTNSSITL